MRRFVTNYRLVLIFAVTALLCTFTVYTLSTFNISRDHYLGAKSANTHSRIESLLIAGRGSDKDKIPGSVTANAGQGENRIVAYRGVSFTHNRILASEIKAETEPAHALESATDTGDGVAPEHVAFKFLGEYASRHESSTFSPQIMVYHITDYEKALVLSESYVRQFEARILRLKRILAEQPNRWEREIPFLPFGISGSQGFHARMKYVNFQNGKGVLFLTQYNIEPALINNQGLTYAFQGLTDDGVYYVSATFPVTAPILPKSYEAESTEDYTLIPPRSFRGREYESFLNDYKIYSTSLIERLEALPPDSYQPKLTVLEDLICSLYVAKH